MVPVLTSIISEWTPHVQISPSCEDTSCRDHHKGLILTWLQRRPYFHIGSHSEVLEVDFTISFEGMHFTHENLTSSFVAVCIQLWFHSFRVSVKYMKLEHDLGTYSSSFLFCSAHPLLITTIYGLKVILSVLCQFSLPKWAVLGYFLIFCFFTKGREGASIPLNFALFI